MGRVFVTGMGIVSALGIGVESNLLGLRNATTGIKKAKHFKSKYSEIRPFAEVDSSDNSLKESLNINEPKTLSRTDLLVLTAFKEAVSKAGLSATEISLNSTALISASTVGGMCHTDELYNDAISGDHIPSPYIATYGCSAHTKTLAKHFKIKGIVTTINTACSSSANAIMMGARLIKSGRADRVIVGGADSLAKFTANGFNALGILSENPCRPFDTKRDGLTLGEGAAYLVLESDSLAKEKNKLAEVTGYGNSNDAFHPSAISQNAVGPTLAMKSALKQANLSPSQIGFINAHGTGTLNNDETELQAFVNVFPSIPPFISTKPYTGHTLGAAGAVEAIYSILSLENQEFYPGLSANNAIQPFNILPNNKYQKNIKLNHIISNSFGFSGNCTSLIFSKA
jgi:3-oxoacyl-(acyl-carrier-protein) synthase